MRERQAQAHFARLLVRSARLAPVINYPIRWRGPMGLPGRTLSSMFHTMLQAKLHRVRVTQADLHYEGSCGIDEALLDVSGMREFQYIEIYNVSNGERFSTYVIKAARDSGEISLNGAAARRAMVGDLLIICAYSQYPVADLERHVPVVVLVDEHNRPRVKPPSESRQAVA
jgi:aspartate 1-decarboxylase